MKIVLIYELFSNFFNENLIFHLNEKRDKIGKSNGNFNGF